MLYNIKLAGGLKASPMHVWLGLASSLRRILKGGGAETSENLRGT